MFRGQGMPELMQQHTSKKRDDESDAKPRLGPIVTPPKVREQNPAEQQDERPMQVNADSRERAEFKRPFHKSSCLDSSERSVVARIFRILEFTRGTEPLGRAFPDFFESFIFIEILLRDCSVPRCGRNGRFLGERAVNSASSVSRVGRRARFIISLSAAAA